MSSLGSVSAEARAEEMHSSLLSTDLRCPAYPSSEPCHVCGRGNTSKLRLSVRSLIHLPVPTACCRRAETTLMVRIKEIEPAREEKLPLPATFLFEGASLKDDGCAAFPSSYIEVTWAKGWRLRFEVLKNRDAFVGFAEIDVEDLARKTTWRLLLSTGAGDAIYGGSDVNARTPAFLEVVLLRPDPVEDAFGQHVPGSGEQRPETGRKRVMIMTRGTRGDVQPYVALARGLASERFNCEVTIVTEIAWKKFITDNKEGLPPGSIHFRPSGGDTALQTSTDVAVLALKLGQHSDVLQSIIFSKSEQNFFTSEGCFYFWAKEERPDFIVFGFTVTHLAMIISEALQIPIVGFVMQPARSIETRPPAHTILSKVIAPMRETFNSTEFNAALMHIMQKIPDGTPTLNRLRRSRDLTPFPSGLTTEFLQYTELQKQGIPQVVPINPLALGEHHVQEIESCGMTLTDFIFLRNENDKLDAEILEFIAQAKRAERPLVAITFSSMPVGARKILDVAVQVCDKCLPDVSRGRGAHHPALIVFVGGQDFDPVPKNSTLESSVERLTIEKRLLVRRKGAPFGLLFAEMDAVITQGGLGTTSEALIAGIPAIVSGILLMDQRYWAARVAELGIGPAGIYIDSMLAESEADGVCEAVRVVKKALDKRKNSIASQDSPLEPVTWYDRLTSLGSRVENEDCRQWYDNAQRVKEDIERRRKEQVEQRPLPRADADFFLCPDGIGVNASAIFEAGCRGVYVRDAYVDSRQLGRATRETAKCCVCTFASCLRCLFCSQLPACLIAQFRLIFWLGIPLFKVLLGPALGVGAAILVSSLTVAIWSVCCHGNDKDWEGRKLASLIAATLALFLTTAVVWYLVFCYFARPRRRVQVNEPLTSFEPAGLRATSSNQVREPLSSFESAGVRANSSKEEPLVNHSGRP